jgi:hypothetical protein
MNSTEEPHFLSKDMFYYEEIFKNIGFDVDLYQYFLGVFILLIQIRNAAFREYYHYSEIKTMNTR